LGEATVPTVECPHCFVRLNAPAEYKGRKVKCKNCGKQFVLRFASRSVSTGSTINLDNEDLTGTLVEPQLTNRSVKMSITVEPPRVAIYQQVTDERFNGDFSAFALMALDMLAEQLGYPVNPL
jgi:hypothetical protein